MDNLPISLTDIHETSTENLQRELARVLATTAEDLTYLAAIFAELEGRGEDMSDIKRGLGVYLPAIAAGKLDPEVVVKFAGRKMILNRISALPITEQRELSAGKKVTVLRAREGGIDKIETTIDNIKTADLQILFDSANEMRSPSEQLALLERRGERKPKRTAIVAKRGGIEIDGKDIDVIDICAAIAKSAPGITGESIQLPIRMGQEEMKSLRDKAEASGVSVADLIRGALASLALIGDE